MSNAWKFLIICFVSVFIFVLTYFLCRDKFGTKTTQITEEEVNIVGQKNKSPPCIHEKCEERFAGLNCSVKDSFYKICDKYAAYYEHHCTCDTWGNVEKEK